MSLHKSLKIKGQLKRQRNVLSRLERIQILKEEGVWSEDDSVFGLPKVQSKGTGPSIPEQKSSSSTGEGEDTESETQQSNTEEGEKVDETVSS